MASQNNHGKIVKLLLQYRAPIEAEDFKRRTPLFKATEAGHLEVVKILVRQGADMKVKDAHGMSLEQVALMGKHFDVYYYLIKYKPAKCPLKNCWTFG